MRRRTIADWIAGVAAVAVLALGGLVVVKPAVDHWDDLYRGDPFRAETTTEKVRTAAGKSAQRTTTTTGESRSFAEGLLGKGGLLVLRVALVVLTAFLAAAMLHRVLLGNYALRSPPGGAMAPAASARRAGETPVVRPERAAEPVAATDNGRNGDAEADGADLASSIGKFVAWRREELGLSQRELGKRAGVSHTVISRLESGQQVPSPKTLERLAEAFREDA
jgi:DNA-binding XRE family transcriptional regulator